MDQLPYYFENVRRSALVVFPKQPFMDWLTSIEEDNEDSDVFIDHDVYLLPDFEDVEEMEEWLEENFENIWVDQMNHWYVEESLWETDRTFEKFKQWFDYSMHTMIWDTEEGPIEKE